MRLPVLHVDIKAALCAAVAALSLSAVSASGQQPQPPTSKDKAPPPPASKPTAPVAQPPQPPVSKKEQKAAAAIQPPALPPGTSPPATNKFQPFAPPLPGQLKATQGELPLPMIEPPERLPLPALPPPSFARPAPPPPGMKPAPSVPATKSSKITSSTSTSGQFIVHGEDLQLRSAFSTRCEEIATSLRKLLNDKEPWVLPIVVLLKTGDAARTPGPAVSFSIAQITHGGFHLQVTVKLRPDLRPSDLRNELVRMLLAERIVRNQTNLTTTRTILPDWLLTGVIEALDFRQRARPSTLFAAIFKSGKIYGIEEIIAASPVDMDALSKTIYQTSCCALVLALLDQPEGNLRFGKFLSSLAADPKTERELLNQWFPSFAASPASLNKWWSLQLALLASPGISEPLSAAETVTQLEEALTLHYVAKPSEIPKQRPVLATVKHSESTSNPAAAKPEPAKSEPAARSKPESTAVAAAPAPETPPPPAAAEAPEVARKGSWLQRLNLFGRRKSSHQTITAAIAEAAKAEAEMSAAAAQQSSPPAPSEEEIKATAVADQPPAEQAASAPLSPMVRQPLLNRWFGKASKDKETPAPVSAPPAQGAEAPPKATTSKPEVAAEARASSKTKTSTTESTSGSKPTAAETSAPAAPEPESPAAERQGLLKRLFSKGGRDKDMPPEATAPVMPADQPPQPAPESKPASDPGRKKKQEEPARSADSKSEAAAQKAAPSKSADANQPEASNAPAPEVTPVEPKKASGGLRSLFRRGSKEKTSAPASPEPPATESKPEEGAQGEPKRKSAGLPDRSPVEMLLFAVSPLAADLYAAADVGGGAPEAREVQGILDRLKFGKKKKEEMDPPTLPPLEQSAAKPTGKPAAEPANEAAKPAAAPQTETPAPAAEPQPTGRTPLRIKPLFGNKRKDSPEAAPEATLPVPAPPPPPKVEDNPPPSKNTTPKPKAKKKSAPVSEKPVPAAIAIDDYAAVMKRPDRKDILGRNINALAALQTRANILFRPIIADYSELLKDLAEGKTKDADARIKTLRARSLQAVEKSKAIRDALDVFEANETPAYSGKFDDYLNLSETIEKELPQRDDPISKYLDALDKEFSSK